MRAPEVAMSTEIMQSSIAGEIEKNWRHFDSDDDNLRKKLESIPGLSFAATKALLADQPRPRYLLDDDAIVLICRMINSDPEQDPEEMVSLRMWCDGSQLVSIAKKNVTLVADVQAALKNSSAPPKASEILLQLIEQLTNQIRINIRALESATDELEDQSLEQTGEAYQEKLKALRHQTIWLKRFAEPQSEAFEDLLETPPKWLTKQQLAKFAEVYDASLRAVETIRAIREHTMILQDHLSNQSEITRQRVNYLLTLVAGVFLPINLIAGLLGANVGGIPGAHNPQGFLFLCIIAATIGLAGMIIIQKLK